MHAPINICAVVRDGQFAEVQQAVQDWFAAGVSEPVRDGVARQATKMIEPHLGQTLLFFAVQRGRCKEVRRICELLVDTYCVPADHEDRYGQTALHYLAKGRLESHVDCVKLFQDRGCDFNHEDKIASQTPLFYAARYSTPAMVQQLVQLHADPNKRDSHGQTPLFWVSTLDVCKHLVQQCRACPGIRDQSQRPASSYIHRRGSTESETIKRFLDCCEVLRVARAARCRITWTIPQYLCDEDQAGGSFPAVYFTSESRTCDVDQLCSLEDEFIADHQKLLSAETGGTPDFDEAVFQQIGLHPDATTRRTTVAQIAAHRKQDGPERHYTLKCESLEYVPAKRPVMRIVGYVYFRLCAGDLDNQADMTTHTPSSSGRHVGDATKEDDGNGYIIIGHLKVARQHQRRGLGKLLMAGMLRVADRERRAWGRNFVDLSLSVLSKNTAAVDLYRSLGFAVLGRDVGSGTGRSEWLEMRRSLCAMTGNVLEELSTQWLRKVPGGGSSASLEEVVAAVRERAPASHSEFRDASSPNRKLRREVSVDSPSCSKYVLRKRPASAAILGQIEVTRRSPRLMITQDATHALSAATTSIEDSRSECLPLSQEQSSDNMDKESTVNDEVSDDYVPEDWPDLTADQQQAFQDWFSTRLVRQSSFLAKAMEHELSLAELALSQKDSLEAKSRTQRAQKIELEIALLEGMEHKRREAWHFYHDQ